MIVELKGLEKSGHDLIYPNLFPQWLRKSTRKPLRIVFSVEIRTEYLSKRSP
jgi:hypothetical protein